MKKNRLKEKLALGKPVYGAMVQFPDADLVEMLGHAGFDWILIDAEHGSRRDGVTAPRLGSKRRRGPLSIGYVPATK